MLRLAAPVICQFVLDKSVQVTAIVLVGHLGPDQLAATSLGASLANVTGNSFLTAFASGLSTLCGQASAASQNQQLPRAPQLSHTYPTPDLGKSSTRLVSLDASRAPRPKPSQHGSFAGIWSWQL